MRPINHVAGISAIFLLLVGALRALDQGADETVYASWWDDVNSVFRTEPVGSGVLPNPAGSAMCGPGGFELEIILTGGVPGKTYHLEASLEGGAWELIQAGDYASWDEMAYKRAKATLDDEEAPTIPRRDDWFFYWPTWPYDPQFFESVFPCDFFLSKPIEFKGGTSRSIRAKYINDNEHFLMGPWADQLSLSVRPAACGGSPDSSCRSCTAGSTAGQGNVGNRSIFVSISLGPDRLDGLGGAAGLHVVDDRHGAGLYSPNLLAVDSICETVNYTPPSSLTSVYRVFDSGGILDKIVSPGCFIDVVPLGAGRAGYELKCYHLSQVDSSTWTPNSGQTPHTTWLFEDVNDTGGTQLFVIKKPGGSGRWTVYNYRFSRTQLDEHLTEQGWSLEIYDAQQSVGDDYTINEILGRSEVIDTFEQADVEDGIEEAVKIKTSGRTWTNVDTVESTGGTLIESWEKDYAVLDGNHYVVTEHRIGVGSSAEKSTIYDYTMSDGRPVVQHQVDSDGRWTHTFSYGPNGRPTLWVEQYQNNAYNPSTAAAQNREFYVDGVGGDLETTTEKVAGVLVGKRWRKLEDWGASLSGENNRRKITAATATVSSASGWNDASNLSTVTYLYDQEAPSSGKRKNAPWLVVRPDGQATLTKYFYDTAVVNSQTVDTELVETWEGVPSTTAPTNYTATITAGTKTVEERTFGGQLVYRRVSDIASNTTLDERLAVDFDAFGRVTEYKLFSNNSLSEKREYACCGLKSETSASGVKTEYEYDVLGRLQVRIDYANGSGDQPPLRREFVYDALNRKTQTLLGPVGSEITEEEKGYNLAGEPAWSLDGMGRETTFGESESAGHIVHTTTAPGGAVKVEKRYQDGSLYETISVVTPSITRGVRYSYASDSFGNRSVTETPLNNGTLVSSAAVVRWTDFAGRSWKTVSPDPDESGMVEETRYYATPSHTSHKLGQLYKIARTGRPDTLVFYDSLGRTSKEGEDINADGSLTASGGTDRLREFAYSFQSGYATVTTTNWVSSSVYLTTLETTAFNPVRYTRTLSAPGRDYSIRTISFAPSSGTETLTVSEGALVTTTITKFGRVASVAKSDGPTTTYAYNAYGRLVTQTDARNGATTRTYDNAGRLSSITTPDPDPTVNDGGRRPQTLTYAYVDLGSSSGYGRRETVSRRYSGITGTIVEESVSEYYPTGELRLGYGANTTPGLYAYDFAGRLKTLTTWRDFNLSTGAGTGGGDTTTWNYNDAGLLKNKRHADSKGPDYTYDSAGRLKTREWARSVGGVRLKATYDYSSSTGDLTGIDYSDNTWTTDVTYSGHDRLGRPASVTDGSGTRVLTYASIYPLAEEYTAGALATYKITATRDAGGRLNHLFTEKDSVSDYLVYYYWGAGNRLDSLYWWKEFDDPVDGYFFQEFYTTYTYEANSDLVSQITRSFYDSYGEGFSGAPLVETRTYDYLNRAKAFSAEAENEGVRSLTYTYNDRNQRARATNAAGSYWSYGYDSDSAVRGVGQVSSAVRKVSGGVTAPGFEFGYAYDSMGNRASVTANGQTSAYYQGSGGSGLSGGSALNQYGSRGVPRVLDIAGLADSSATVTVNSQSTQRQGEHWFKQLALSGNAAQWQSVAVAISTGGSSSGSILLKEHPEVYTYDDDGNLTMDGRWTYTWDAENRLVRMETAAIAYTAGVPRKRIDYAYDDRGRRILKSVYAWNNGTGAFSITPAAKVGFLYQDWNLLQEVQFVGASSGTLRAYYWGLDLSGSLQGAGGVGGLLALDAGWPLACVSDANGNVTDLVGVAGGGDAGLWLGHYEYDAFGNAFAEGYLAEANPFRFSTKYTETDAASGGSETGLVYYGLRYYNPSTGRWLSRDPIGERGGRNLYGMVGNNPVIYVDYLGLECCKIGQIKIVWTGYSHVPSGFPPNTEDLITAASELNSGFEIMSTVNGLGGSAVNAAAGVANASAELGFGIGGGVGGIAGAGTGSSYGAATEAIGNAALAAAGQTRPWNYYTLIEYKKCERNWVFWTRWSKETTMDSNLITSGGFLGGADYLPNSKPSPSVFESALEAHYDKIYNMFGRENVIDDAGGK